MLDGSGNFVGKSINEIKEETGIKVKKEELVDLTELAYGDKFKGAYPSPGGSAPDRTTQRTGPVSGCTRRSVRIRRPRPFA